MDIRRTPAQRVKWNERSILLLNYRPDGRGDGPVRSGGNAPRQVRRGEDHGGRRGRHVQQTLLVPPVTRDRGQADPVLGHVFDPEHGRLQRVSISVPVHCWHAPRVRSEPDMKKKKKKRKNIIWVMVFRIFSIYFV